MRIFLLTLLLITPCFAQKAAPQPCTLTLKDAPSLRGLKLGMSEDDFKTRVAEPGVLLVDTRNLYKNPDFDGVKDIRFDFYQEKLISLELEYDRSIKWKDVKEFATSLSVKMKLPFSWRVIDDFQAEMPCVGFTITANSYRSSIKMLDGAAKLQQESDSRKAEEHKKRDFRPEM